MFVNATSTKSWYQLAMQKIFSTVLVTEKGAEFNVLCVTELFILHQARHHWGCVSQQEETGPDHEWVTMPHSVQWRDCHHHPLQPRFLCPPPADPSLFLQWHYRPLVLKGTAGPLPGTVLKGQLWDTAERRRSGVTRSQHGAGTFQWWSSRCMGLSSAKWLHYSGTSLTEVPLSLFFIVFLWGRGQH